MIIVSKAAKSVDDNSFTGVGLYVQTRINNSGHPTHITLVCVM